jgi:hypothetical protein
MINDSWWPPVAYGVVTAAFVAGVVIVGWEIREAIRRNKTQERGR